VSDRLVTLSSTWLFTIARNLSLSTLAKKSVDVTEEVDVDLLHHPSREVDPSIQYEQYESIAKLRQALTTLSATDREIIAVCYTPEISHSTEVLKCSEGTQRTRLSRARKRLLNALSKLD